MQENKRIKEDNKQAKREFQRSRYHDGLIANVLQYNEGLAKQVRSSTKKVIYHNGRIE